MHTTPASTPDASGWYEIRLDGRLDPLRADQFDGLTLTEVDGRTVLRGPVADQAALHGVLQRLRDLAVPLVSLTRVDDTTHRTTGTHRTTTQGERP